MVSRLQNTERTPLTQGLQYDDDSSSSSSLLSPDSEIEVFFNDIKRLKELIASLEERTMALRSSDAHQMANIDADALALSMDEASRLMSDASAIRSQLVRLYSQKQHWRDRPGSSEERLFSNAHTATSKRFLQVMETLHATFSHLKTMHKANIERQLRLGTCHLRYAQHNTTQHNTTQQHNTTTHHTTTSSQLVLYRVSYLI
jgi:dynactin complex subunit